jgi:hypothetical protein
MSKTIRSEVLTFVLAAQDLLTREAKEPRAPLSDHENEKIVDCLVKLEEVLFQSDLSRADDGKVGHSEGDAQDSDGYSADGDGHP